MKLLAIGHVNMPFVLNFLKTFFFSMIRGSCDEWRGCCTQTVLTELSVIHKLRW